MDVRFPIGTGGGGPAPSSDSGSIVVTRSGAGGAGATSSSDLMAGRVNRVRAEVVASFNAGATAEVGFSTDSDALVTAALLDAAFLSAAPGWYGVFDVDVAVAGTGALVVTSIGASSVGSLRVTAFYGTPGS